MSIPLECACGKSLTVPDEFAGKKVKCTNCFQILPVPAAASTPSLLSREPGSGGQRAIPKTKLEQPSGEAPPPPPLPIHARTMLERPSGDAPPPTHARTMLVQPSDTAFQDEPQPAPARHVPTQGNSPAPAPRRTEPAPMKDRVEVEPSSFSRQGKPAGGKSSMVIAIVAALGVLFLGGSAAVIWFVVKSEDKQNQEDLVAKNEEKDKPKEKEKEKEKPPVEVANGKLTPEQLYRRLVRSTTWIVGEDGSSGSGVLIDAKERLVLTNHHVIAGSSNPVVYFPAFAEREAVIKSSQHYLANSRKLGIASGVVWRDPRRNLAILQLSDDLPPGVPAVPLAPQSVPPGAKILAIGNSGAEENEMWRSIPGLVRGVLAQNHPFEGKPGKLFLLMTSAATTFGDGGGPVVGEGCNLVGLVIGTRVNGQPMSSLIDIREIRAVVDACYREKYKKGWQDATPAEVVDVKSLPKLIEQLKSSDNKVRAEAVRSLGDLGPDARTAVPVLLNVYKQGDPGVKQQILAALEKIGPPESTVAVKLVEQLDDGKPEMRLYAIRSLTRIGPEGAKGLPGLKKACDDREHEIRYAALFAVDKVSDEDSLEVHPLAIALLKDVKSRPRALAATILQTRGKLARSEVLVPLMTALTDRNEGVVREVEKALTVISPMTVDDVPVLKMAMKDANARVRFFAAYSLQLLEAKALPALAELLEAIGDKDDRVRRAAIGAVGKFGAAGASGVPRLLATLGDADKGLRVAAVEALGGIGRQAGVFPALFTALTDREVEVRATATSALKRVGKPDKADIEGISKFLTDDKPLLRSQAAAALGRLGADAKGSVPALMRMVREDKSVRARLAAVAALAEIGPDAREASETLAKILGDKIAPTDEDLSDLFEKPAPKPGDGGGDDIPKALLRSTVLVGVQRFGGTSFSTGWVVDTANRLIVTTSRNLAGVGGLVFVCFPDNEKGEIRSQLRHYQENAKRLALPARVVWSDLRRELVILQLVGRMPALALPLRIAETGTVAGQTIHAMGAVDVNAGRGEGTLWTHSSAKVRQLSLRPVGFGINRTEVRFIETATQMKCDDSGGPVVDDKVRIVGMVSGKRGGFGNQPQCIDLSEIMGFLADYGKLNRIELGKAGGVGVPRPASASVNQAVFRCGVASTLEKIGTDVPEKVVPALIVALNDASPEVQAATVAAVGSLGGKAKAAYPQLMKMLPKSGMDSSVEEAIVKLGAGIAPDLAKIIGFKGVSSKEEVLAASRILRKMGKEGTSALPELKKHLREREQYWKKHPEVLEAIRETYEALEAAK